MSVVIDVVLGALAAAGLVTYLTGEPYPRAVFIFLVVAVVFHGLRGAYRRRKQPHAGSS